MIALDTPAQRLKRTYDRLVHPRHGLITKIIEENEVTEAAGLHFCFARVANPVYFRRNTYSKEVQASTGGGGAQFSRTGAIWAAIGETIERYCATIYDDSQFVMASAEELGDRAVSLSDFILFGEPEYTRERFPYARPDRAAKRAWSKVTDLATGAERLVPSQFIYLGARQNEPGERLYQSCSTGIACGQNFEAATLAGLCEVMERDAFSAMWQLGATPTRLIVDAAVEERLAPPVRDYLRRGPLPIKLWSLHTDIGVPVIMAMSQSPHEHGRFVVGASCRLDIARAIDKAVIESLHGFIWMRRKIQSKEGAPTEDKLDSPESHMAYFLEPERIRLVDFLFKPGPAIAASELESGVTDLRGLVARLSELGYRPLAADITTEDIAALDLHVARTIIPGLHPLLFGSGLTTSDTRRLATLARFWNFPFDPANPRFNPVPHPFP